MDGSTHPLGHPISTYYHNCTGSQYIFQLDITFQCGMMYGTKCIPASDLHRGIVPMDIAASTRRTIAKIQ